MVKAYSRFHIKNRTFSSDFEKIVIHIYVTNKIISVDLIKTAEIMFLKSKAKTSKESKERQVVVYDS